MRIFIYSILLVVIFSGCEKESKIKIPYEGDKIVLNSFIQPDSLIYVRVTASKPVRESGDLAFPELSNAIVTLYEDGVALPATQRVLINGRGYFVSEQAAVEGKRYSISIASDGLTDVSGADSTPVRPQIRNAQAQRSINRVRFSLTDNATEKNYYRIRVYNADSTVNGELVKNKTDTVKCRLDPAFGNFLDIIGDTYYSEILLSDERINGKDVTFVMQTEKEVTASHMIVEVSALSEGAYKYLLATSSQRQKDENDFVLDPVNIYSNIQNGYGIVAGVNAKMLGFKVE
jgi:hypothetical protein